MTGWTTPADLQSRLRRRWVSGDLLRQWGRGTPWEPIAFGIRGPTPGQIADDLGAAQRWAASWDRAANVRLERRRIGGRLIGVNEMPAKAWIDDYTQAWAVLGVAPQAARFDQLLTETRRRAPRLIDWALAHPLRLLDLASSWPALVETALWIDQRADQSAYLRQVDVPGVDTKFIEHHRAALADLLDLQLPSGRIDASMPRSNFEARYGFRDKPVYLRMRSLDPAKPLAGGYEEVTVRRAELAARPPAHSSVYIVENEITYLAFPPVPDAIALLGGGYAVSAVQPLLWLGGVRLFYWGDIDTHGFAILDRLRQHFPDARSLLMNHATLLAHEGQWVREPKPVVTRLHHLHPDEADLYRDLIEDTLGPSVRLEQERVSYGAVERAVAPAGAADRESRIEVSGRSARRTGD